MRKFVARSESDKFPAFVELCQCFCDEQWVADHFDNEQAAQSVLDQLNRELALLDIQCVRDDEVRSGCVTDTLSVTRFGLTPRPTLIHFTLLNDSGRLSISGVHLIRAD
jgi:hypothetical protein